MKGGIYRYILSTRSSLCDTGEPRYRKHITGYQIIGIGYYSIFDYIDNLRPVMFWVYLRSPISHRKLSVLKTHLRMSSFIWDMSQLYRLLVAGEIKSCMILLLPHIWNLQLFPVFLVQTCSGVCPVIHVHHKTPYFILLFSLDPSFGLKSKS